MAWIAQEWPGWKASNPPILVKEEVHKNDLPLTAKEHQDSGQSPHEEQVKTQDKVSKDL